MSELVTKIENVSREGVKSRFEREEPPEKGMFVDPLWWNMNENGRRCLLCYEPMTDEDRYPDNGFPTYILYFNGVRRIGAVHPECYASHCHQMKLFIKKFRTFYNKKCGKKNIDKVIK